MHKRILFVTDSGDLHADLVEGILAARGHQPFRLILDNFPRDYQLAQEFHAGRVLNRLRRLPAGEWLDCADVGAIWSRKPAEFSFLSDDLSAQERAYAKQETEQALFGLLYTIDCYWMNHPRHLRGAAWKGEQLQRAARMGFRVPASLVTNDPALVRAFRDSLPGKMIFKSMSTPTLAAEEVARQDRQVSGLNTTIVDEEMMEQLGAVAELPCHFQEFVDKAYELRVTIIGQRVFAARISSSDEQFTMVDSRRMCDAIRYEAVQLPAALEQRCRDFVHSYGLDYGALDLAVTPEGEAVFLENNPGGQFLYVEQLVPELRMLEAIADKLIEEAKCRS
jgi:glutathione synthase/RimK-type ligase-like ATP-grasp enzyme